jgi:hypothetical protein
MNHPLIQAEMARAHAAELRRTARRFASPRRRPVPQRG